MLKPTIFSIAALALLFFTHAHGEEECEISGYPDVASLALAKMGLSWCPVEVDLSIRLHALNAAWAYCGLLAGDEPEPEDWGVQIANYCETLDVIASDESRCACPHQLGQ